MSDVRSAYLLEKVGIDYQDRRSQKRGPGKLSDCLLCGDEGQVVNGVLLDISVVGAKVRLDKRSGDEDHVDPSWGKRLMVGAFFDFPVEIIWQEGPVIGLRFSSDSQKVAAAIKDLLPRCLPFDDAETEGN